MHLHKIKNIKNTPSSPLTSKEARKHKHAFTLVELIVTITIIAILGAIAFTAFNGFQSGARDSSRATDLTNLSQALDTYYVKIGSYPNPDNSFTVTYSGGYLWYQGTVGDTLINTLSSNGSRLSRKPTDPLNTTKEYTYSKSAYGNTYEMKADWEGDSLAYTHLIPQAFAASDNPTITYIKGNYNGMVVKTVTGSVIYVIATPSITTSTGTAGSNIDVTTLSGKLLYHGQTNSGGIAYTPTLIYTGLTLPTNDDSGQITLLTTNLQSAYTDSPITSNSNISNVLTTTGSINITSLGANIITHYLGGSASAPPSPPATSYTLTNSLLFDSASSQYLSRTPSVAGNPNKWTWSGWVKRGALGSPQLLFSAATDGSNFEYFRFESTDELFYARYVGGAAQDTLTTAAKYRDPSAWLHVVVNRNGAVRTVYVNGIQVASGGSSAATGEIGQNKAHSIGRRQETASQYFDGYLADVNFVDSGALDPTAFGYADPTTNQWLPKAYTGTYGTNGFHLDFASGASLGKDVNGTNDWTVNGGMNATNNQVIDTPLNNFATLNPLSSYVIAPISGNLSFSGLSAGGIGSIGVASGKYYWESVYTAIGSADGVIVGIRSADSIGIGTAENVGYYGGGVENGKKTINGGISSAYGATWTIHDVIGVALDLDAGTVTFYKNNVSQGIISFTVGGKAWTPFNWRTGIGNSTNMGTINFGQKTFAYTPPSGFKALSTANLPIPTIVNPKQHFDVLTYGGSASAQSIAGLDFQPDFVWIKSRNLVNGLVRDHDLTDSVRGAGKSLYSNLTSIEESANRVTSFNPDGFSLGGGFANTNYSGGNYVAWNWKAGGTAVSNTAGTIASQVSANPTAGFSIISWTSDNSNDGSATIGHGLSKAPELIVTKQRNFSTTSWEVWYKDWGNFSGINLNSPNAKYTNGGYHTIFSSDDMKFSVGQEFNGYANVGATNITYAFHSVPGYSKFGSYTGNGNPDGPFVHTGFRPRYVMIKSAGTGEQWFIHDSMRDTYNPVGRWLYANGSTIEQTSSFLDFTSNGFKIRVLNDSHNTSGITYIYAAFAEAPFKYANAR